MNQDQGHLTIPIAITVANLIMIGIVTSISATGLPATIKTKTLKCVACGSEALETLPLYNPHIP